MKYLTVFTILSVFVSLQVAHATSMFVFSTSPQNISAGVLSEKINVQAQSPVAETTYIAFTSTSKTGQFLTASGGALKSVYISTGNSNRAVYYKDTVAGDFVITAVISDKDKKKITQISQHIVVNGSLPAQAQTQTVAEPAPAIVTETQDIGNKLDKAVEALQVISTQMKQDDKPKVASAIQKPVPVQPEPVMASSTTEISTSTENSALVFEAEKKSGFMGILLAWPVRFFNFVVSLF